MIVKNESKVIERCLSSIVPLIDYWVIVDTGSTDDTMQIICDVLSDIPGELYESPWKNFGTNRSEALDLAQGKCDYILFMDADDTLIFDDAVGFQELTEDMYYMWRGTEDFSYIKPQLVKSDLPWSWIGVTHEYLNCETPFTTETLGYVKYRSGDGGARSGPEKFLENVRLLENGLKETPNNERYMFYLAESYRDAGLPGKSIECYQKRINMGGWDEEIYWSKLQIGLLLQHIGITSNVVIESFLDAHHYRPHRPEALYHLVECYHNQGNYSKAYEFLTARAQMKLPQNKDYLFNVDWMEQYGLKFQLSICTYYLGKYEESLKACDELLAMQGSVPDHWLEQVKTNREFPLAMLKEQQSHSVVSSKKPTKAKKS